MKQRKLWSKSMCILSISNSWKINILHLCRTDQHQNEPTQTIDDTMDQEQI